MSADRSDDPLPCATDQDEMLMWAWAIIANAHEGDWSIATQEWRDAAAHWRDAWHASLAARP